MKPYNEAASCPKCGHGVVITRYHVADLWGCRTCADVTTEHLRRACDRCYYAWNEAPIHSEREEEKDLMPYKIVSHDVDLTPEEQEMAKAVLKVRDNWASLPEGEQKAWTSFEDRFYWRLRNKSQSDLSHAVGRMRRGARQVRWYAVERVDETKDTETQTG